MRDKRVSFRVSSRFYKMMLRAAKQSNIKVSSWLRLAAYKEIDRAIPEAEDARRDRWEP